MSKNQKRQDSKESDKSESKVKKVANNIKKGKLGCL